jgi:hypothetical protein
MKAITVKQPWAWAIIHGGKDIENKRQGLPAPGTPEALPLPP